MLSPCWHVSIPHAYHGNTSFKKLYLNNNNNTLFMKHMLTIGTLLGSLNALTHETVPPDPQGRNSCMPYQGRVK